MLDSVKIARRQSKIRQSLAELVGKETPTADETRSMETMDTEYRGNETRYRAALIAEDTERRDAGAELETRDDRQFAELIGRFELRQVALALDEGRTLTGATAEVVQELRNAGGYQGIPIPLAALETRAGETVAADQINPKAIRPIIDRLFPGSVASSLGVNSINITQGELAFPVATAGAVFGWQTTELAAVAAAAEYKTSERSLNPDHTGGAQMVISRKALKQAGEGLEMAIRRDLNAAIGAELDRVVINGSGAAGQPLGIIPGATDYGITTTPATAPASWGAFRAEIVAFMQANAITSPGQVNVAFDPAIWAMLDAAMYTGTAVSEWDRMVSHIGNPAISNTIPTGTAILTATVQGIAPGYLGIYGGVDLIRDRLIPCMDWDISTRNGQPRAYRVGIPEIGGGHHETVLAGEVLHLRTASDVAAPWSGRSPLSRVPLSASLLAEVETALRDVYRHAPLGSQIVKVPEGSAEDMDLMRSSFKGQRGSSMVIEGVAQATAAGMNPNIGQKPDQLSPDLSKSMTDETLSAARDAVLMAFGVLPNLINPAITGPAVREAQRHLAQWTLQPLAVLLSEEASAKLGGKVFVDLMRPVQAFDVRGRARALSAIVKSLAEAKAAGLSADELNLALTNVSWGAGDGAA